MTSSKVAEIMIFGVIIWQTVAPGGGGGGGTLIFSYVGSGHFFGIQNFEISIFLGFFRKMNIFGGGRFCGYFFGVITKLDYI